MINKEIYHKGNVKYKIFPTGFNLLEMFIK
jgi:hypothetical protein